ncbi:MAG: hypothetical protein CM1200mP20_00440 [Pseudomonadota bacterium]|nr:MAG: hypothetical protein CM1200mP20_00440 [Pseudomonadota bacterium]
MKMTALEAAAAIREIVNNGMAEAFESSRSNGATTRGNLAWWLLVALARFTPPRWPKNLIFPPGHRSAGSRRVLGSGAGRH